MFKEQRHNGELRLLVYCSFVWRPLRWETGSSVFMLQDGAGDRTCFGIWLQLCSVYWDQTVHHGILSAGWPPFVWRHRVQAAPYKETSRRNSDFVMKMPPLPCAFCKNRLFLTLPQNITPLDVVFNWHQTRRFQPINLSMSQIFKCVFSKFNCCVVVLSILWNKNDEIHFELNYKNIPWS